MAKGVKFGGKIDTAYWEERINKTKNTSDAYGVLYDLLSASTSGLFNVGVSDKDQTNIMKLVNKLGSKYNVDVSEIANVWDPSKNHINSTELSKARQSAMSAWTRAVEKSKSSTSSNTVNKPTTDTSNKTEISTAPSVSTSAPTTQASNDAYYKNKIKELTKENEELKNPKVWTAAELAELYGVTDQYDYEKILEQYNNATNKYHDDVIAEQLGYNDDANRMNTTYANNLIKKYLDSYSTQAPTAVGRGVQAANALVNSLNADQTAGEVATNLNSLVRDYEEQRKAELATNATNARTDYNAIGSWLLSQGAKQNESAVQQYVDSLNAYATKYAAARNAQKTLANSAAQTYQYNAQAALNNAAYNNSMKDYKYYQYWYGDNAARAYANSLKDANTTNIG